MADPRVYRAMGLAVLAYLIWGTTGRSKESQEQAALRRSAMEVPIVSGSGVDRQMQIMRFAGSSEEPLYRMSPQEIQRKSSYF